MGLREEISKAKTVEEIDTLLKMGSKFETVSKRTERAWKMTASRRIKEFSSSKDVKSSKKTKTSKKTKNSKKK
jgi:hypothetical protein